MAICDMIEQFIMEELERQGVAELKRTCLAEQFCCVPSQINYVLATRFSPEHGYIVESRRGGGGYIKIKRVSFSPGQLVMHTVNSVGLSLSLQTATALLSNIHNAGALSEQSAGLILTAVGDKALRPVPPQYRDEVRASIFKYMLISTISD